MLRHLLCAALAISLSACSFSRNSDTGLTPLPGAIQDPSDGKAMALLNAYITEQKGPPNSRYDYTRVDLNGDGAREAIFLFKGPYSYWCGWSGCMMVIMKAQNNDFTLLTEITGIRGPLVISDRKTNGWNDLIVRVSGTNIPDRNVAMTFDGRTYPVNPANQTSINRRLSDIPGTRIFP
ncbi:MAG: hypothetical protein AAF569_09435 [Pseudomonadota bacterium]